MMVSHPTVAFGPASVADSDLPDQAPWAELRAGHYPKLRAGGLRRSAAFTVLWSDRGPDGNKAVAGADGEWLLAGCVEDSAARERWNMRRGRRWVSQQLLQPGSTSMEGALPTAGREGTGAVSSVALRRIHQARATPFLGARSASACGFHLGAVVDGIADAERLPLHWSSRIDVTPRGDELLIDCYSELSTQVGDGDEQALTHDYLCAWVDLSQHRLVEVAVHPGIHGPECTLPRALRVAESAGFDQLRRPSDVEGRCRHELGLWDALVSAVEMLR